MLENKGCTDHKVLPRVTSTKISQSKGILQLGMAMVMMSMGKVDEGYDGKNMHMCIMNGLV